MNCAVATRLSITILALLLSLTASAVGPNLTDAAKEITDGVGSVRKIDSAGKKGWMFVFEEFHTSRVGQLQIAIMLKRLHDRYGLKRIGLEGSAKTTKPLDTAWFRSAGGDKTGWAREDVAVRMLSEGEISAAEFITLIYADMEVYGIESPSEYRVKLDTEGNPQIVYLITIAEKGLGPEDIQKVNELIQDKKAEALDYLLSKDPWVKKQYNAIKDMSATSTESIVERIREIKRKAQELEVQIEPQVREDMDKTLHFFEMASKRSSTMVNNALTVLNRTPAAPIGIIIGAAHTQQVIKELKAKGISFAQIAPLALNTPYGEQSLEEFDRKSSGKWARTSPGTLGELLNRKPPPIVETESGRSYASINMASLLIGSAIRSGGSIPESIWDELASLPDLRVDRDSFEHDGDDVIFRAWLKGVDSTEREVWARVGTIQASGPDKDLELKLQQAIADLGGGGKEPPRDPPPNSERVEKEGPGDGKRGGKIITRANRNTLVVYAKSKEDVTRVGKISG